MDSFCFTTFRSASIRTMTLDLTKLGARLRAMGEHLSASRESRQIRLDRAHQYFAASARDWEQLATEARRGAGSSAAPLEPLDDVRPQPTIPAAYEVLATDGSTIEPDRHGPAMCAVINVGHVRIRYGVTPMAQLGSTPRLL